MSVVAGVLVAVGFSALVHLNAISLGFVVAAALLIGRLLRLGAELLEVPISAMLVLAVGGGQTAATGRVSETVIGAAVGILVNAVIAPPLYLRPAGDAVRAMAHETAEMLRRMSAEVSDEYTRERASSWLDAARGLGQELIRADRALAQAEESLRLNPRALKCPHAGVNLRTGLDALEHSVQAIRIICRSLLDRPLGGAPESIYGEDVRRSLSTLLLHMADAVEAFGQLIGAHPSSPQPEDVALRKALDAAWTDRDRLIELLRKEDRLHAFAWQLHGDLVANVDRVLREIDPDERARLRESWVQGERHPVETVREALRARRLSAGRGHRKPRPQPPRR